MPDETHVVDEKKIQVVQDNTSKALVAAKSLVINSTESMEGASELLTKINRAGDMLKKTKESVTKPLNETLKRLREMFAPAEAQYKEAKDIVGFKMVEYQDFLEAQRKKEEEKIAKKVETGRMKLETAAAKMEALPEVQKKVESATGKVTFREDKKAVIFDHSLVPCKFHVVDEVAVRKAALAGEEIPGVKIEIVKTPVNTR